MFIVRVEKKKKKAEPIFISYLEKYLSPKFDFEKLKKLFGTLALN